LPYNGTAKHFIMGYSASIRLVYYAISLFGSICRIL
jgi:hypothetical protein